MTTPRVFGDDRYRTVGEARIIEALIAEGLRYEVAAGRRAAAEAAAQAALERSVALGLGYRRAPDGQRLFDPAEASNALKWDFRSHGEGAWPVQFLPAIRRQVWEPHGAPSAGYETPPDLDRLGPQRYAVIVRRTLNLSDLKAGERIRLRLPAPIEDTSLSDVRVDFLPPEGAEATFALAPARLDATLTVPAGGEVTLGLRAEFTARVAVPDPAARLDAETRALYVRPSEGLIKVSPRVRALAVELAARDPDPMAALRRFWAFMLDELTYGGVHYDALDPGAPTDWVLEHGWYDCKIGSALLVALCRARGMPARLVCGYLLWRTGPGYHTWSEVWIDGHGWLPMDLSSWLVSAGGRDAAWRDYYFGRLDHRMTVERPPRLFSGPNPMRLPKAWQMLTHLSQPGSDVFFEHLDNDVLACREHIEVERLGPA